MHRAQIHRTGPCKAKALLCKEALSLEFLREFHGGEWQPVVRLLPLGRGSGCWVYVHRDMPWGVRTFLLPLLLLAISITLFTNRGSAILWRVLRRTPPGTPELLKTLSASMMVNSFAGKIDASDIFISQHPDGSDWLLGAGSSGQVRLSFHAIINFGCLQQGLFLDRSVQSC